MMAVSLIIKYFYKVVNFLIFTLTNWKLKSQIFSFGLLVPFQDQTLVTLFFSFLQIVVVFTLLENLRSFIFAALLNELPNSLPIDIISPGAGKEEAYCDFWKSSFEEGHIRNINVCSPFYNQLVIKKHIGPNKVQGLTQFPLTPFLISTRQCFRQRKWHPTADCLFKVWLS